VSIQYYYPKLGTIPIAVFISSTELTFTSSSLTILS